MKKKSFYPVNSEYKQQLFKQMHPNNSGRKNISPFSMQQQALTIKKISYNKKQYPSPYSKKSLMMSKS